MLFNLWTIVIITIDAVGVCIALPEPGRAAEWKKYVCGSCRRQAVMSAVTVFVVVFLALTLHEHPVDGA